MTFAIMLNAAFALVFVGGWAGAVWLTHRSLRWPRMRVPGRLTLAHDQRARVEREWVREAV